MPVARSSTSTGRSAACASARPVAAKLLTAFGGSYGPARCWVRLETPPFYAFAVTYGITFTFGGLRGDVDGRVLETAGAPIEGLFVCGEMLGGLFSDNYPGGTGLAAGMVFGRRAGTMA